MVSLPSEVALTTVIKDPITPPEVLQMLMPLIIVVAKIVLQNQGRASKKSYLEVHKLKKVLQPFLHYFGI